MHFSLIFTEFFFVLIPILFTASVSMGSSGRWALSSIAHLVRSPNN